ncbi:unnamed protein product, partial [Choristocarpus tenellus]
MKVQRKSHIPKVMFISAILCPDPSHDFDGKIGIWQVCITRGHNRLQRGTTGRTRSTRLMSLLTPSSCCQQQGQNVRAGIRGGLHTAGQCQPTYRQRHSTEAECSRDGEGMEQLVMQS